MFSVSIGVRAIKYCVVDDEPSPSYANLAPGFVHPTDPLGEGGHLQHEIGYQLAVGAFASHYNDCIQTQHKTHEERTMSRWATIVLMLTFFGMANVRAADEPRRQPNFVFIIADDLGWADVAFHGGNTPTPQLDRLAQEGLELTRHYVAPVCSPTRAGLLSGRYWSRFGVTTPTNTRALPWDTVTLPGALRSIGYETCLTGKWHLGSLPECGPNHFGFDHSYGSLAGGISPWNHFYKKGPFTRTWHRNEDLLEEQGHVTDLLAAEAIRWIEGRSDSPFFLYVPFTAVHLPIKEPEAWLARVPDSIQGDVPRHYAACVMHLDDAVGRIVAALERTDKRRNTLLVFTSDNGGSTVENNDLKYPDDNCPNGKLPGNNLPWRGGKGNLYEGGIRVPTIVSWPGHVQPGKANSPVQIIDWMPTFCALAGYEPAENLKWDGVSIARLLTEGTEPPQRPLYTAGPRGRSRSLHLGDWKLIVHSQGDAREIELFHLKRDPAETINQAGQHPEQVESLLNMLEEIASRDGDAVVEPRRPPRVPGGP
jgi:arylsulfatase A-like enzyme